MIYFKINTLLIINIIILIIYKFVKMNNNNNININIKMLNIILKKLNDRKKCRHTSKKLFNVDKILNINTKQCNYVGGTINIEIKTHLQIKFTSPDQNGIILISVLFDKYNDLVLG